MWGEHQGSSGWPLECHQTVHSRDPVIILGLSPIGLQHEAKISNLKTGSYRRRCGQHFARRLWSDWDQWSVSRARAPSYAMRSAPWGPTLAPHRWPDLRNCGVVT